MAHFIEGTSAINRSLAEKLIREAAPDNYAADGAIEVIVDRLFSAIYIDGSDSPIESWRAPTSDDLVAGNANILIYRYELRKAVDAYLNYPAWIRHPFLDWLCANTLLFAEVDATLAGMNARPIWKHKGKIQWGWTIAVALWRLSKWAIWLLVLLAALGMQEDWAWISWVGLTIAVQFAQRRNTRRRADLWTSMLDAYSASRSSTLSWSNLWDLLTRSRDKGAVWDQELYVLVETRKSIRAAA